MKTIELSINPEWLVTLDVLARRDGPPASWPPGKPYSEEEHVTFGKQQPRLHEIILETLGEIRPEEEIASLYAAAERASLDDLRDRFRALTVDREPSQRERHTEEWRRIGRANAFYDTLWSCEYEFEGAYPGSENVLHVRRNEDLFESVRESIRCLVGTLCP